LAPISTAVAWNIGTEPHTARYTDRPGLVEREGARGSDRRAGRGLVREGHEPGAAAAMSVRGPRRPGPGGFGHQDASRDDGEVGVPEWPCPSQITRPTVAMYGGAAICVIRLAIRTRQRKDGGPNICGQPGRHTYLARYMRGRKEKNRLKTTMSFRSGRAAVLRRVRPPRRQE
jgi:hypothetical protein